MDIEQRIAAKLKRGLPFLSDTAAQLGAADIVADLHLTVNRDRGSDDGMHWLLGWVKLDENPT